MKRMLNSVREGDGRLNDLSIKNIIFEVEENKIESILNSILETNKYQGFFKGVSYLIAGHIVRFSDDTLTITKR